ncbi:hypothetical protein [Microvirga aerilata]
MIEHDLFGTIRLVRKRGYIGSNRQGRLRSSPPRPLTLSGQGPWPSGRGLHRPLRQPEP